VLRKKVVNGNATNHFQKLVEKEKEKEAGHEHDMIWGIVGGFWIRLVLLCYYAYISHTHTHTHTHALSPFPVPHFPFKKAVKNQNISPSLPLTPSLQYAYSINIKLKALLKNYQYTFITIFFNYFK